MPRPQIVGLKLRQIDMNHTGTTPKGRTSNKDYRITISVDAGGVHRVYTEYGPAGRLQNGREESPSSSRSLRAANAMADNFVQEKQNQRDVYRVTADQDFSPPPVAPSPVQAVSKPRSQPKVGAKSIASLSDAARRQIHQFF